MYRKFVNTTQPALAIAEAVATASVFYSAKGIQEFVVYRYNHVHPSLSEYWFFVGTETSILTESGEEFSLERCKESFYPLREVLRMQLDHKIWKVAHPELILCDPLL